MGLVLQRQFGPLRGKDAFELKGQIFLSFDGKLTNTLKALKVLGRHNVEERRISTV